MIAQEAIVYIEQIEELISFLRQDIVELLSTEYYGILFDYETKSVEEKLSQIDDVKMIKATVLNDVINSYNDYLLKKYDIERELEKQRKERNNIIELSDFDIKKTGIMSGTASLLFPPIAPIALGIGIPIIGLDYHLKKTSNKIVEINSFLLEEYEQVTKFFYSFADRVRTDYHNSIKELDELKKKVLNGGDITSDLLKILNPTNIGLKRIPLSFYIDLAEEEAIQYQK